MVRLVSVRLVGRDAVVFLNTHTEVVPDNEKTLRCALALPQLTAGFL
jgi:hypothetical protein